VIVALTRPVSPSINRCELVHLERVAIDLARAEMQHEAYERLLGDLGATVVPVEAAPELPDATFVEDTAVVLDELAVIARPGASSRRPELVPVSLVLSRYRPCVPIGAPGTLDGGDVVRVGRRLFVGLSRRTNAAGAEQFERIVEPLGYDVTRIRVEGCLHLKSACTAIGDDAVLVNPRWLDVEGLARLDRVEVPAAEPDAANVLRLGSTVIMADGFPATRRLLERRGLAVRVVDIGEFRKAEGGVTCKSIVFDAD
jgi:dimethylargininase